MRSIRAARMAPAIAANSRPPSRRKSSSGSPRCGWCSATAVSTASILRFRPSPLAPVPGPTPVLRLAAEETVADGGGDGRVADAHLADAQQVGAAGNRFHAESHGGGTGALIQRRFLGDVAGRHLQRQVEDLEAEIVGDADLIDGGAAGGEIGDHLGRHLRRERRHALPGHAMIAGEDRDQRAGHGRSSAGPGSQPFGNFLEPAPAHPAVWSVAGRVRGPPGRPPRRDRAGWPAIHGSRRREGLIQPWIWSSLRR